MGGCSADGWVVGWPDGVDVLLRRTPSLALAGANAKLACTNEHTHDTFSSMAAQTILLAEAIVGLFC